jgi:predicted acylesterase/phospholipase RssA
MGKKTAFVLSGGGASGAWQVGALKAFMRAGIEPDFISANSAGSLNAVGLSYAGIDALETVWRSIKERKDIFSHNWPYLISLAFGRSSFMSSKPLRQKIEKLMEGKVPKYPICVNSVSLKTGLLRNTWDSAKDFKEQVVASASIPVIVEPVNGEWVDGGIRENAPLHIAIESGAERIFLFLNCPKERLPVLKQKKKYDSLKEIGARVIEIMMDEEFYADIAVNEHSDAHSSGRKIEVIWIQPQKNYLDTMDFEASKIQNAISRGFLEANIILHGLRKDNGI